MNFRHLDYFIALAEELHFGRAAQRLHIVQPALSQQIARMEEELGVRLLERTKRHVALTDAGRVFLREARALQGRYDHAVVATRRAATGHVGDLVAGFVGPAAYSVLHSVVQNYRSQYPDVALRLHELTSSEQLERVAGGSLDVGFVRLPVADERFDTLHLLAEPIIVVLPEGHPQTGGSSVDLAELADEPFIMVPRAREPTVFDRYIALCQQAGFSPRITQEVTQIHTIVELVAVGLGVALAPASLVHLRRPGVVYRPPTDPAGITTDTGLVWRKDNTSTLLRGFIEAASTRPGTDPTATVLE